MATQVQIVSNKFNIYAQKMRSAINMSIACKKDEDNDGLRVAIKQLDDAVAEFKRTII